MLPFHRDVSVFISSAAALAIVTLFVTAVRPRHVAKAPRRSGGQAFLTILAGLVWPLLSALPLHGGPCLATWTSDSLVLVGSER
jgi:hypothetical protein